MSLSHCCRLFGISRQAIYKSQDRVKKRLKELSQVKLLVESIRRQMPRIGTRKLYYLLKNELVQLNIKMGRDALFDYLRSENLLIRPKKNYTRTTYSNHWLTKHPNMTKEMKPQSIEQVFVSDITYVNTKECTYYLSLVTDAYSRKIMGYALSDDMKAESVAKALKMAIKQRKTNHLLIHHSDRGLQYCSSVYQKVLTDNQMVASMTDGYDCYQNALAERINGILKQEFLIYTCNTGKELETLIKQSIDTYNNKRPHLSLNLKTPNFIHEKTEEEYSFGS